ncbi:Indoleamine 2,3-dioxygenase [Salix suchowensis]|nr:Indoleamine 2,3-dioxygenase [Salix suchowensis]
MPPQPPADSLPTFWKPWEVVFRDALGGGFMPGDKPGITDEQKQDTERWRASVRQVDIPTAAAASRPHVFRQCSIQLHHPFPHTTMPSQTPTVENIRSQDLFTGTKDEEEFYLCSARIELAGVEALSIIRDAMNEIFIGDSLAVRRITAYLSHLSMVIKRLKDLLMSVRDGCDPETYYTVVRPWFRGEDSDPNKRRWIFEGMEQDSSLKQPVELSGPSAGQSSMVHALDLFLGIQNRTPSSIDKPAFLTRMLSYMPRHHRAFLIHIANTPRPLRDFVMAKEDAALLAAYNTAVTSLKEFRDSHMIIATLYIVSPARRAAKAAKVTEEEKPLKGTGGTDLVKFLKDTRDRTKDSVISS